MKGFDSDNILATLPKTEIGTMEYAMMLAQVYNFEEFDEFYQMTSPPPDTLFVHFDTNSRYALPEARNHVK